VTDTKGELDRMFENLKRMREEVELKIHLGAADVRDEWEDLEKKWDHFRGRMEVVGRAAEEAASEVGDALELVGAELKKGYERIRNLL
jgi:hypothetical protein